MPDSSSREFFTLDGLPVTFVGVFANETFCDEPVTLRDASVPLFSSSLERYKIVKRRLQLGERSILFFPVVFLASFDEYPCIAILGVGQLRLLSNKA